MLSLNLFQALKKVSWGCQPEPVCNSVLLESQKNKIPHLGLEGREWRRYWARYKVWKMSSVQAIFVQPASSRDVPVYWERHLSSAVVFGLHCWASGCGTGTWWSCFSLPREVRTMLLILAVGCKILGYQQCLVLRLPIAVLCIKAEGKQKLCGILGSMAVVCGRRSWTWCLSGSFASCVDDPEERYPTYFIPYLLRYFVTPWRH